MANKITERDIYNSILDGSYDVEVLKGFAEKKLAQLDKRNATAKVRAAKKRAEADVLTEQVFGYVSEELKTRAQITAEMVADGVEITEGKVGYRLTVLSGEEDGRVVKTKGKIAGDNGKTREVVFYALAE